MWLCVKELSSYLSIKEKTIYSLVGRGEIPCYRIGKLVRFKQEEVDQWLDTKKVIPVKKVVDKILTSVYTSSTGDRTASRGRR